MTKHFGDDYTVAMGDRPPFKPPSAPLISLRDKEGNELGFIRAVNGRLEFEGEVEESAKVFFDFLVSHSTGNSCPPKFIEWLRREMPPGTVISDPEWWAPRVYKALMRSILDDNR